MADAWLQPWEEAVGEFPLTGSTDAQLRSALAAALRAPSPHNTQPWWCRIRNGAVEVHADRRRALPVADPQGRELLISCGALIEQLHLTLRHFGYDAPVRAFPDPLDPDCIAQVGLGRQVEPTELEHSLSRAIRFRRTNRRPYSSRPVPDAVLGRAVHRAEERGARLQILPEVEEHRALAMLIAEGDRFQLRNVAFRRELASWLRPLGAHCRDGMPASAGRAPKLASVLGPAVMRRFDLGKTVASRDRLLAEASPALAVLWSPTDSRRDWVATGRALTRVLLSFAADAVSSSFLNQPLQVPWLREEVRRLFQAPDLPQVLLRMGYGPEVQLTPRRELAEVLRD